MKKKDKEEMHRSVYGLPVRKVCATCDGLAYTTDGRTCDKHERMIEPTETCADWKCRDGLDCLGCSYGGRVKRKEYLYYMMYVRRTYENILAGATKLPQIEARKGITKDFREWIAACCAKMVPLIKQSMAERARSKYTKAAAEQALSREWEDVVAYAQHLWEKERGEIYYNI